MSAGAGKTDKKLGTHAFRLKNQRWFSS